MSWHKRKPTLFDYQASVRKHVPKAHGRRKLMNAVGTPFFTCSVEVINKGGERVVLGTGMTPKQAWERAASLFPAPGLRG